MSGTANFRKALEDAVLERHCANHPMTEKWAAGELSRNCLMGIAVEHPFGTIKAWMGATHFLMKRLPRVATEMALHVLAYNLTRVMNILGIAPLIKAMRA